MHNFNPSEEQLTRLKALLIYKKMQRIQIKKKKLLRI